MIKKILMIILSLFLVLPLVSANMIVPLLSNLNGILFYWMIVIILIESLVAFFILRKFSSYKINFFYSILIITVANIVSFIFGLIILIFSPRYSFLGPFDSLKDTIFGLFTFCILSILIEFSILWLFIRSKLESSRDLSFIISLIGNIASYLFIFLVIFFISLNYNPYSYYERASCMGSNIDISSASCKINDKDYHIDISVFNYSNDVEKLNFFFQGGNSQIVDIKNPASYSFDIPIKDIASSNNSIKISIGVKFKEYPLCDISQETTVLCS